MIRFRTEAALVACLCILLLIGSYTWWAYNAVPEPVPPPQTIEEEYAGWLKWMPPGSTNLRELDPDHCWILFDLPIEGKVHTFMYRHAWDIPVIVKISEREQEEGD